MPELSNIAQYIISGLLEVLLALLPGMLLLRVLRLMRWRNPLLYPIGLITGFLIVPLLWYLGATFAGGSISLAGEIFLWLLLVIGLILLNLILPDTSIPMNIRWRDIVLLYLMGLTAAIIVYTPMIRYGSQVDETSGWYYRNSMHDWTKHIAMGNALILSNNVPPPNPFLSTDQAVRYHYFAYMVPATAYSLSGNVTVGNALTIQAILIAFAMPFIVYGYGRISGLNANAALIATFLVSLVSGLDVLYAFETYIRTGVFSPYVDSWIPHSNRRINGIPDMYLWTPQHILGIQAFVLSLWIIAKFDEQSKSVHIAQVTGLACLLAALCGTSSLVWLALLFTLGVFTLLEGIRYLRHKPITPIPAIVVAVAASFLISGPHLIHMLNNSRTDAPIVFTISPTLPGFIYGGIFSQLFGQSQLTYLLDFPFQMIPEFGVMLITGIAGMWIMRKEWGKSAFVRLWTIMMPIFFFFVLATREGRGDVNNYAPRIAPMAMILLGLFSGFLWMHRNEIRLWKIRILRGALGIMVILGLMTAFYEPFMLRQVAYYVTDDDYALYQWLNDNLGPDDVYQIGLKLEMSANALLFVEHREGFADNFLADAFTNNQNLWATSKKNLDTGYTSTDPATASNAFHEMDVDYVISNYFEPLQSIDAANFSDYFSMVYENDIHTVYKVISQE